MSGNIRDRGLDLSKWLAISSMVLDHLRYIWPSAEWLFVIGRFAFPLFCLGIAANVARAPVNGMYADSNARYLIWMIVFAIISELPYRLLSYGSGTLNVIYTLIVGLLIAWGVHHKGREGLLLALIGVGVAALMRDTLMYGFFGALLPAALVLAILKPHLLWSLPALLSVLANCRNYWVVEWGSPFFGFLILLMAFISPLLGLWLLRHSHNMKVWPVRRWAYWFYPGHMLVLYFFGQLIG